MKAVCVVDSAVALYMKAELENESCVVDGEMKGKTATRFSRFGDGFTES